MSMRLGCRQNSCSDSKSVRLRKLLQTSLPSPIKFRGTLVILCLLFNYLTDYYVLAKPGAGEPSYHLELGEAQNFTVVGPPTSSSHPDTPDSIPESIRASLSSFCEKCSDSQKKKVEQILLLLFNFNQAEEEAGGLKENYFSPPSSSTPFTSPLHKKHGGINKPLKKKKVPPVKKVVPHEDTKKKRKVYASEHYDSPSRDDFHQFHVTSAPKSSAFVPTPDTNHHHHQYYANPHSNEYPEEYHGVIQLPTTSTTPTPSTSVFPSRVLSIYPRYNSLVRSVPSLTTDPTFEFNPGSNSFSISTTVSSALGPAQSVEMPTPPMPPTTSGPIYVYYLNSPRSSSTATSSSSIQPPTTPVVESSLASRATTIEP